jgi:hypothetical protein
MSRIGVAIFSLLAIISSAATQQPTLAAGQTIQGTASGEAVSYTITGEAGQNLIITASSDAFDIALELYDEDNVYLIGDDNTAGGSSAQLGVILPDSGSYRVSVLSYYDLPSGPFTLTAETLAASTGVMTLGVPVRSFLSVAPQHTLTLEQDTAVMFTVYTQTFSPLIRVLDSTGSQAAVSDGGRLYAPLKAGTYSVTVEDFYPDTTAPVGRYFVLTADAMIVTPLSYGATTSVEAAGSRGTILTFDAQEGDLINLRVNAADDSLAQFSFIVYGPDNVIAFYSEGTERTAYLQRVPILQSGTYVVDVAPYTQLLNTSITATLEKAERLVLSSTPTSSVFTSEQLSERYTVNVEAGRRYRLSIETDNPARPVTIFVQDAATQIVSGNLFGGNGISLTFTAAETTAYEAVLRVDLSYSYDTLDENATQPANITVSIEEIP